MDPQSPRTLTTGEAADWCGVSFRTVIRWVERGELKAYKLPGRGDHRIRFEDFLEFLKRHDMPLPPSAGATERRALVVEDDAVSAKLAARVLQVEGFQIQVAETGFQAGALLAESNPTLILLDLRMPGLGGLDVIRLVRSMPRHKDVKILVVSGTSQAELDEAIRAGADQAVRKPVEPRRLREVVATMMGIIK